MEQRTLGSQGLRVSALGLGCMGMTFAYGGQDDTESRATLERALELGVTFLDTADMYGPHTNEELLGSVLSRRRDEVTLATKFGNEIGADGQGTGRVNGRPDYLRGQIDGSLQRLGTDHVDLYYQHRVDPEVPIEETWGALGELVEAGKVRFLGISEAAPETIRRAHATAPVSAVQTEYSLFTRDVEDNGVLATCRELGIGFVPYSPIGRGFLAGTIRSTDDLPEGDWRRNSPRFQGEALQANLRVLDEVNALAERKGVTPTQLALAWVLAQGSENSDVVPIPGTKRRRYLEENVGAVDVPLSAEELEAIEKVAPAGVATGERYPAAAMKTLNH
ncbi:MAG: Oxidoreductase, aldo/keto reductase family [uncultured Actinomycetospora sp.]|uniref:Oxidoreductase, aldo/keto reductase family n=1 Tax=uncultured Actinomycetospora sp. TaxID=1135996 RepID=A0A6J4JWR4_9PSEU|nr:MAG: Oxidoreductase, aldo/keto reductase family [uncultured Actinomycetospora sp.]